MTTPDDIVIQMAVGPMQNFAYLAGDSKTREVMVIDPSWEADRILKEADENGLKISGVLLTHSHYDHTNALEGILSRVDVPAYIHAKDASYLEYCPPKLKLLKGSEKISCGNARFTAIHTPGHTAGSVCYLLGNALFSGDTLFVGASGRCDLAGSDATEMYRSLTQRLKSVSDAVILYPGHHYGDTPTSSLGRERQTNPYLLCKSLEDYTALRMGY